MNMCVDKFVNRIFKRTRNKVAVQGSYERRASYVALFSQCLAKQPRGQRTLDNTVGR
jgi:hypothetical protein